MIFRQSTEQYWKHFTEENLEQCENSRQRSILLRQTLDAILINAARDLRTQADIVERALQDRVTSTDEIREKLENDLTDVSLQTKKMKRKHKVTVTICSTFLPDPTPSS